MRDSDNIDQMTTGADRRKLPRQSLLLSCIVDAGGAQHEGRLRDVSAAGAFVETACPLAIGSDVAIRERDAGLIAGRIVRREGAGIAVAFRFNEQAVTFALRAVAASMAPRLAGMEAM
jgi:hypothetical protein